MGLHSKNSSPCFLAGFTGTACLNKKDSVKQVFHVRGKKTSEVTNVYNVTF